MAHDPDDQHPGCPKGGIRVPRHRSTEIAVATGVLSVILATSLMCCLNEDDELPGSSWSVAQSLARPTNVRKVSDDPCTIEWRDNSDNEDGFRIILWWRTMDTDSSRHETVAEVGENVVSYTFDTGCCGILAGRGGDLEVEVAAFNQYRTSYGKKKAVLCPADKPNCPSNPWTTSTDPLQIAWDDQSNNEEGFRIWVRRSSDPACGTGTWEEEGSVGPGAGRYNFGRPLCAVRDELGGVGDYLCVRIEAYRGAYRAYSGTVNLMEDPEACSPPSPPSGLWVSVNPCLIQWSDASNNEERFHIYAKKSSAGCESAPGDVWVKLATVGSDTPIYSPGVSMCEDLSIPGLGPIGYGERVCVRVAANNSYGEASSDPMVLFEKVAPSAVVTRASYQAKLVCNTLRDHLSRIPGAATYGIATSDSTQPDSVSLRVEPPGGKSLVGEASAFGGTRPGVRIECTAREVSTWAQALMGFEFQLIPIRADAPENAQVPIICKLRGQTTADAGGDVRTEVQVSISVGGDENIIRLEACPTNNPLMCHFPSAPEVVEGEYPFNMDIQNNNYGGIMMQAWYNCGYQGSIGNGSGSSEIVVESVEIDPSAQINGTPATQLYRLVFSKGVLGS